MVKNTNTRITITISKKQYKWLTELCEEKNMKMSKLISWLLYQKTIDVVNTRNLLEHPEEELSKVDEISNEEILEKFYTAFPNLKETEEKTKNYWSK